MKPLRVKIEVTAGVPDGHPMVAYALPFDLTAADIPVAENGYERHEALRDVIYLRLEATFGELLGGRRGDWWNSEIAEKLTTMTLEHYGEGGS